MRADTLAGADMVLITRYGQDVRDRYRIVRRLPLGGAAEVFDARQVEAGGVEHHVTLRRFPWLSAKQPDAMAEFLRGAETASNLAHPSIWTVLDYGVMDDMPFHVLEPLDGVVLDKILPGTTSPEVALAVAWSVSRGLAHAHGHRDRTHPEGLVHLGINPAAVLLTRRGEVKVLDFGIAAASKRVEKTAVGPVDDGLSYAAAEQVFGGEIGPATDVFSLGCVMYAMLVGHSPLKNPEVRTRLRTGIALDLSPLPSAIADLLGRTLVSDPASRPTASGFADACRAALDEQRSEPTTLIRRLLDGIDRPRRRSEDRATEVVPVVSKADPLPRFASAPPGPMPETRVTEAAAIVEPRPPPEPQVVSSQDRDPLVGTVLHGYRLEEPLGMGALARVYRARHLVLDHSYAVKILYGAAAGNERARLRLRREAQALSRLRHPNIVGVVDFGTTDAGHPFLTMELVDGLTVHRIMQIAMPLSGAQIAHVARQVAVALDYAHSVGIVHRDIKPSNVMVMTDGQVKVLDFGIARLVDAEGTRVTTTDTLLGTPRYMAPEQITGASEVGPPADLYALGVMIYALLAGDAPFIGSTLDVVERQLTEMPPPLRTSTGLEPLVMQLLEKQPAQRPASGAAVIEAIDRLSLTAQPAIVAPGRAAAAPPRRPAATAETSERAGRLSTGSQWPLVALLIGLVAVASAVTTTFVLSPKVTVHRLRTPPPPAQAPVVAAAPEAATPVRAPPVPAVRAPMRPAPAPTPARDFSDHLNKARALLKTRGLTAADLREDPELRGPYEALKRAVDAQQPAAIRRAERALADAAARSPTPERLRARLDAFGVELRRAAGKLETAQLASLEDQYLDLRARARGDAAPDTNAKLLRRLTALAARLEGLTPSTR